MRVGYSRISDIQQAATDPLAQAEHELRKAGAELVLVEVGSGTDDAGRPKFRQLRELVLAGQVTEVITPNQDRLGRNLALVLDFVQLCHLQGVALRDLNGRELEVKTADGRLMTTLLGALDEHRSKLYGEKTRRHLQAAREQGFPARPRVPFGLRKVRDGAGRFVAIDIDPVLGPLARQRIDWFLAGSSVTALCQRIAREQPEHKMQMRQLRRWLESPLLTGRLAWHKDDTGRFEQVAAEQTFPALISDAEAETIRSRLSAAAQSTSRAVGSRELRMFSGLVRCADCGKTLVHKVSGRATWYLRCANPQCPQKNKTIRVDRVFAVMQWSCANHARALVPLLDRPAVDPPQVVALQAEIQMLEAITGTDAVIAAKRKEIAALRGGQSDLPAWALVAAMRSPMFWLQSDAVLNQALRLLLDRLVVQLGPTVAESRVALVRFKTPHLPDAELPVDQDTPLMPMGPLDLAFAAEGPITEALAALGLQAA